MSNSYLRHPNNYLVGTRMLTLEERGAYADIIDLYIARDGDLPDDDRRFSYDLACDPRVWRRIKRVLIDTGKIEIIESMVVPTGGPKTLRICIDKSQRARIAAKSRWGKRKINPLENKKTTDADNSADNNALDLILRESNDSLKKKFLEFKKVYPSRKPHGNAWSTGEIKFNTAVKNGATADHLIFCAENYAEYTLIEEIDPKMILMCATWLYQKRWEDFTEKPKPQPSAPQPFP